MMDERLPSKRAQNMRVPFTKYNPSPLCLVCFKPQARHLLRELRKCRLELAERIEQEAADPEHALDE